VTYTDADWALETTAPVDLYAVTGTPTFDKGDGNLCASCHQPRREAPVVTDLSEMVTDISTHWGPHHGPQSAMLLGVAGALPPGYDPGLDTRARHYTSTEAPLANGCVSCHMGPNAIHSYEAQLSVCQDCHATDDFDYHGVQTLTQARLDVIGAKLVDLGVLSSNDEDGHPTVTSAEAWVALPLFNWLYVAHEDKSLGVHNPRYTSILLTQSCAMLGVTCPNAGDVQTASNVQDAGDQ